MTTEKTSSPRRSGADWFGLIAFAVLVICSAVLVVRLISTKFLPTGQLLLAVGALLVLSGLHGWVQLPHREKTGGKIACGIVALVLAAAMLYGAVALGSVQHAITDVADKSVETDITCVIVNADDPAQSLDDVKGYRFGILEDRDTENTQSLLQQLQEKLGAAEHTAYASPALLTDALYDDQVGAILLNKGYIPLLEEQEGYADFSDRTRILYEYTTTKTVEPAPADTNAQVDVTKDPFVVYCSGIDARSSNINITSRSDVNILAVVNPTTRQILLVNTPPGLLSAPGPQRPAGQADPRRDLRHRRVHADPGQSLRHPHVLLYAGELRRSHQDRGRSGRRGRIFHQDLLHGWL